MEIKFVVITKILDFRACLVPEVVYDIRNDDTVAIKPGDCAAALEVLGIDSNKEIGYIRIPIFNIGGIEIIDDGVLIGCGEKLIDFENKITYKLFDDIETAIEYSNNLDYELEDMKSSTTNC
jgi:hypothetical protein